MSGYDPRGDDVTIDWANDFELFDAAFVRDPYPIYDDLRAGCPVAHSERRVSTWMPTTYADVSAVAHDTEHFSSSDIGVVPGPGGTNSLVAPPITSDPPFHGDARRLLLPAFSPHAIDLLEPTTAAIADELIDAFVDAGRCDAAADYAQHLPVRVISLMLGIPAAEEAQFTDWVVRILQIGQTEPEVGRQATKEVLEYFRGQVELRRREPGDDLVTYLLDAELGGAPLTEKHVLGTCFLILVAGIDTTWSSIGASLLHLATHPDDTARLTADPTMIDNAVEELLRAYAPVTMARQVVAETEVAGRTVCPGEKILLTFPAANRDPEQFERPDEVLIDRQHNRHLAFGAGIHRCLGSNLARMELRVALGRWLARIPRFELAEGADVPWNGGQVRGPRSIPVVFDS